VSLHRSDNELFAEMQAGRTAAFDELYDRYRVTASRTAMIICGDAARADEAVQEAFASIWNARATYRPDHPTAAAWILTVVRNRAIDIARRDGPYESHRVGDGVLAHRAGPDDVPGEAVRRASGGRLHAHVRRLPDVQREAIELAFYAGLSQTEIAARLGVPLGTVKARIRRGMGTLRRQLGEP
jgi:RNA polymerase sigma-70 factor, ECF subfamily